MRHEVIRFHAPDQSITVHVQAAIWETRCVVLPTLRVCGTQAPDCFQGWDSLHVAPHAGTKTHYRTPSVCLKTAFVPLFVYSHCFVVSMNNQGCWSFGLVIGPAFGGLLAQPVQHFPAIFSESGLFGRCVRMAFSRAVLPATGLCMPKVSWAQGVR